MNRLADKLMEDNPEEYERHNREHEIELDSAMSLHYNLKIAKEGVRASIYALIKVMHKQGDADTPIYLSYKKQYVQLCDEVNNHEKMMEVI